MRTRDIKVGGRYRWKGTWTYAVNGERKICKGAKPQEVRVKRINRGCQLSISVLCNDEPDYWLPYLVSCRDLERLDKKGDQGA